MDLENFKSTYNILEDLSISKDSCKRGDLIAWKESNEGCWAFGTYVCPKGRGASMVDVLDFKSFYKNDIPDSLYLRSVWNTPKRAVEYKQSLQDNDKLCDIKCIYSNRVINFGCNIFQEKPFSKISFVSGIKNVLEKVVKKYGRTSPEGLIAKSLINNKTIFADFAQTDKIGAVGYYLDEKSQELSITSLNFDKFKKAMLEHNKLYQDVIVKKRSYDPTVEVSSEIFTITTNILFNNCIEHTKIGRLVKKCLLNLYPDRYLELFVHAFNAEFISFNSFNINVVEGDELVKWYNVKNYTEGRGTLQNSCMRHPNCKSQLLLYKYLPVKMVTVVKEGLLHARALLWNLDTGEKYMDRIYYTKDSQKNMLMKWGYENGYTVQYDNYYKSRNEVFPDIKFDRKYIIAKCNWIEIQDSLIKEGLIDLKYSTNNLIGTPYLDTFTHLSLDGNYIGRSIKEDDKITIEDIDIPFVKYGKENISNRSTSGFPCVTDSRFIKRVINLCPKGEVYSYTSDSNNYIFKQFLPEYKCKFVKTAHSSNGYAWLDMTKSSLERDGLYYIINSKEHMNYEQIIQKFEEVGYLDTFFKMIDDGFIVNFDYGYSTNNPINITKHDLIVNYKKDDILKLCEVYNDIKIQTSSGIYVVPN